MDLKTFAKYFLVILAFIFGIAIIYFMRNALYLFLASIFIAIIIDRPVTFLTNKFEKLSRGASALIVSFLVIAILIIASLIIFPFFIEQAFAFVQSLPTKIKALSSNTNFINEFVEKNGLQAEYKKIITSLMDYANHLATSLGSFSINFVGHLIDSVINLIFIIILTFSFLFSGRDMLFSLIDKIYLNEKRKKLHISIITQCDDVISNFFIGQLIVAIIAGCLMSLCLFVLCLIFSIPMSIIPIGFLLIFILSFVPMFGGIVGTLLLAFIILLYNPIASIVVILFSLLYGQIEGNLISPRVQSKRLNMHPLLVLILVIIGLKVFGGIGPIILIPLGGIIMIIFNEIIKYRKESFQVAKKTKKKL